MGSPTLAGVGTQIMPMGRQVVLPLAEPVAEPAACQPVKEAALSQVGTRAQTNFAGPLLAQERSPILTPRGSRHVPHRRVSPNVSATAIVTIEGYVTTAPLISVSKYERTLTARMPHRIREPSHRSILDRRQLSRDACAPDHRGPSCNPSGYEARPDTGTRSERHPVREASAHQNGHVGHLESGGPAAAQAALYLMQIR